MHRNKSFIIKRRGLRIKKPNSWLVYVLIIDIIICCLLTMTLIPGAEGCGGINAGE